MGKFEYKTIDTSTLAGLREAERLQADGWRIIRSGLYLVQFERRKGDTWGAAVLAVGAL